MTNKLNLVQRIAAIALCVCFTQTVHYSQTGKIVLQEEVVRLRSNIDFKDSRHFVFSPASKLMAVQRGDGSVQIIDITNGREQAVLPLSDKATAGLEWTTDGLRLLVVDRNSAAIWDARRGTRLSAPIETRRGKYFQGLDQMTLSPDEKSFLTVKKHDTFKSRFLEKDNFRAQVWDFESGRMRFEVKINGLLGGRAQLSPDSKLLLTSSETDDPRLWDVETGRMFATLKPREPGVLCGGINARFSPDGRFVVVHRYRCGAWIWDSAAGVLKNEVSLPDDHIGSALMGFTPDGKMFAMAQQRHKGWGVLTSVELRECETGELRSTLTATKWEDWPQYVLWSNDGRTFVATSGHKYKGMVWDVSTGRLKATIPMVLTYSRIPFDFGFKDRDALSIHPTLPVITATSNKLVRLWNAETGELMQTLENTGGMAEWSTDGKLLLTSTEDRTRVFVWDVVGADLLTRTNSVESTF